MTKLGIKRLMSEISLEDIVKIAEVFDAAAVPLEDRSFTYIGKDSKIYTLSHGCYVDDYMREQMPDWIRELML